MFDRVLCTPQPEAFTGGEFYKKAVLKNFAIFKEKHLYWSLFFNKIVGLHHIKTSQLICSACQWTGFYTIGTFVMKKLKVLSLTMSYR